MLYFVVFRNIFLYIILGVFARFQSDTGERFQTRSGEEIGSVKNARSFGRIKVILSQRLA